MSTTNRAYERLVAANPIPDPEQYMATVVDLDAVLRDLEEVLMDTKTRPVKTTERAPASRRWVVAAAAFAAVLIVGATMVLAMRGNEGELVGDDQAVGVVESFFDEWNAGDAEATVALLHPEATVNLGVKIFGGWVEWTIPFDGQMETACVAGATAETVTCQWAWVTAGTEALGLAEPAEHTFIIEDGLITRMTVPNYGAFEGPMTRFAQSADAVGYAEACRADGTSVMSIAGYALNERCGAFVAQHEAAFVAGLGG